MRTRAAIDVSELPLVGFGHRAPQWWAQLLIVAIEGTMFGLATWAYLYMRLDFAHWPPAGTPVPDLGAGTANVLLLVASVVPMVRLQRLAPRGSQAELTFWMVVSTLIGVAALVLRAFEFPAFHVRWDTNGYGSLVWLILGLHTFHLIAETGEEIVLTGYLFVKPLDGKHRIDLEVNSLYWYFIVGTWVPLYTLLYFGPRIL